MIPYLALLFIVIFITHLGRRRGSPGVQRFSLAASSLLLVLFAGFRNQTVGTDTYNYVSWLNWLSSYERVWTFHVEKGFTFIVFLSSQLSENYYVLLSFIAIICVASYLVTIVRLVPKYETAIFLFITLGSYTFFFNGARQGIAGALCFLALPFLLQRRAIPYILLILLATLFHKTAFVALPLFYLAADRVGWKQIAIILASAVIMAVSVSAFVQVAVNVIGERYASYGNAGKGGGEVKAAFLVAQAALFLLFHRQTAKLNPYYARLLNIYLIGLIPAIASVITSVNPSGILRLSIYFEHTAILLWPMIFASFVTRRNRTIVSAGFLFLTLAFFVLTTINFSDLTPYLLNSEIFS